MPANKTYRMRGELQKSALPATQEVAVVSSRRLLPGSSRASGLAEVEVGSDEVVRVELENGFALWMRADDLFRERGRKVVGRDGGEAWEIDTRPPQRAQRGTRGWLGLGIKVLDFFGVDLHAKAARELCEHWETKHLESGKANLYRCSLDDSFSLSPVSEQDGSPADQGALLVLIHGTGSNCVGGFGELWDKEAKAGKVARETLKAKYGQRVFAFEHRSLTVSPIVNALELAQRLPQGAEVHLVTHSRGGLVGELLCLGERDPASDPLKTELITDLFAADRTMAEQIGLHALDEEAAKTRDQAYAADRQALLDLLAVLEQKKLKIRRFVRVACPARGTTLASGRLDRWLSVLTYFTPNELVGDMADFLLGVVKERTDPRTLPGLEAMMPGSALTRLLQHPDLLTASDLSVIAGDTEGDSLWSQIKLFVADWFYGADHDLVVNTGSMFGGIRRPDNGARFLRDVGGTVNHFHYFKNDKSVRWLVEGLQRADGADGGFQPIAEAKQEAPRWREALRRSRSITTPRPLAVVLPGTMGSALQVDNKSVWLNYRALLFGGLKRIRMGTAGVEPTDLLDDFYGPLLEFLTRSHRVEIVPYDWRLSVREAAARLADRIEAWLPEIERTNQPVHLVAHSMGGLVVRAMIADGGRGAALWRRIVKLPNSRFMMLGTPNLGSYEAVRWLTGHNPTQAKLSLLDITQSTDEIVDLVRQYPGLLELLPFDAESPDFSQASLWKNLQEQLSACWNPAEAGVLAQARSTWDLLRQAALDGDHMVYVAGCQDATVVDYHVVDNDEGWPAPRRELEFIATREGDGTVAWKSGLLPGVKTWYVEDTAHDELCAKKRAFPAYLDLLMSGGTSRLPATPPSRARAAAGEPALFVLPVQPPIDSIPDEASLRGFGFGPSRPFDEEAAGRGVPVMQVSIRHGNLAYAKHPVLVGHYLGDGIYSAEKAVDERLDRALSQRLRLGLYPGRSGTHALFFNERPAGKPGGAIVVGLGQVGDLTPGILTMSVRDAMLDYALRVAQWPDDRFGPADSPRSAALTCLLVGTGAGGMTVRDSVEAILRGATAANTKLVLAELEDKVIIDRLEFLEVYEDAAIAAADALAVVLSDGQLAMEAAWTERVIEEGEGKLYRVRCDDMGGWWHRLEIKEDSEREILRFVAATNRARAEETLSTGQLRLADDFIRQASQSPSANAEVAKTLFEMLLPNRLKELAPQEEGLVLMVDEVSARYPWELLEDRWSHSGRPPAVAAGLVRQLKTPIFRAHPAHAIQATALVVGNPDLAGWDKFSDLPGARQEAQKVAALLGSHGYRTMDFIDERADVILSGLHKDAWRILHLAGHGEHEFPIEDEEETTKECADPDKQPRKRKKYLSGMVIGKNTFLTPGDVEQMRWVPELVFVNCCHLGKTQGGGNGKYGLLAANLAAQFILMGVKAVVAAGWAVDDAAGQAFAESFYRHMLAGEEFGDAVRAAREEIWVRHPDVNTWGAYQCYGDPSYRLHGDGGGVPAAEAKTYHAPVELIADLQNDLERIRMQLHEAGDSEEALSNLRQGISQRFAAIPESERNAWLARADVAAVVGFAWGETRAWAEAIEWLEKALASEQGDCPVRAVEQCANFRVRLSSERWQQLRAAAESKEREQARLALVTQIESAIDELAQICHRAPTGERLSLLGGACKRLAWVCTEERLRLEALVNMANYYRQAYEKAGKANPYPFTNWAVAELLAAKLDDTRKGDWEMTLPDECERMIEVARQRNADKPNFWDGAAEADGELVKMLLQGKARGKEVANIVDIYRTVFRRGASPREMASVQENLDFLIALAGPLAKSLREALNDIRAAL